MSYALTGFDGKVAHIGTVPDGDLYVSGDFTAYNNGAAGHIVLAPTLGEFVEIANPTSAAGGMSSYYLADHGRYFPLPAGGADGAVPRGCSPPPDRVPDAGSRGTVRARLVEMMHRRRRIHDSVRPPWPAASPAPDARSRRCRAMRTGAA